MPKKKKKRKPFQSIFFHEGRMVKGKPTNDDLDNARPSSDSSQDEDTPVLSPVNSQPSSPAASELLEPAGPTQEQPRVATPTPDESMNDISSQVGSGSVSDRSVREGDEGEDSTELQHSVARPASLLSPESCVSDSSVGTANPMANASELTDAVANPIEQQLVAIQTQMSTCVTEYIHLALRSAQFKDEPAMKERHDELLVIVANLRRMEAIFRGDYVPQDLSPATVLNPPGEASVEPGYSWSLLPQRGPETTQSGAPDAAQAGTGLAPSKLSMKTCWPKPLVDPTTSMSSSPSSSSWEMVRPKRKKPKKKKKPNQGVAAPPPKAKPNQGVAAPLPKAKPNQGVAAPLSKATANRGVATPLSKASTNSGVVAPLSKTGQTGGSSPPYQGQSELGEEVPKYHERRPPGESQQLSAAPKARRTRQRSKHSQESKGEYASSEPDDMPSRPRYHIPQIAKEDRWQGQGNDSRQIHEFLGFLDRKLLAVDDVPEEEKWRVLLSSSDDREFVDWCHNHIYDLDVRPSWHKIKLMIRKEFSSCYEDLNKMQEFWQVRQPKGVGRGMETLRKMETIQYSVTGNISELDSAIVISFTIHEVLNETYRSMIKQQPINLYKLKWEGLKEMVCLIDGNLLLMHSRDNRSYSRAASSSSTSSSSVSNRTTRSPPVFRSDFPQTRQVRDDRRGRGTFVSPTTQTSSSASSSAHYHQQGPPRQQGDFPPLICYRCQGAGHRASECTIPKMSLTPRQKSLRIRIMKHVKRSREPLTMEVVDQLRDGAGGDHF